MSCAGPYPPTARYGPPPSRACRSLGQWGEHRQVRRLHSLRGHDRPVREVGQHAAACVDQPRLELRASVVATPPPGRGVGHHAVRGWSPEPEQSRPKRFVGAEDSALVFRMRAGFIGQQEACPRHHPCGPGGQRPRVSSAPAMPPPRSTARPRATSSAQRKNVSARVSPAMCPPADAMLGEPPLQSPIHDESDDGHVDPRLDAHVDVAAAEKRHQQVDRH